MPENEQDKEHYHGIARNGHPPRGVCQGRQRGLQLGRGRTGDHARLCNHAGIVRLVPLLRYRRHHGRHFRRANIHQDEHGRGRSDQIHRDAHRGLPVHHRRIHRTSGLFRLPDIKDKREP